MNVTIKSHSLKGNVVIPPSKSLSHRAIIAASLASGKSVIKNVLFSEDIKATIKAMRACGAKITEYENYLEIEGSKVKRVENEINANESGSTIRFMIPIALVTAEEITFKGENHLVKRPLDTYTEIFDKQGIKYEKGENHLPMKVSGALKPGDYYIRGDISSQFITGLLYALPQLSADSIIHITTEMESKGYIDLTLDILKKYNIEIENRNYKEFYVKGNQEFKPCDYTIEGDYSQAAFFLLAGSLGADITLLSMNPNSHQGDKKIVKDILDFGGEIIAKDDTLKSLPVTRHNAVIDFANSPDLGPALSVLASLTEGHTEFINASRLRIKECDRITCMKEELIKLGAKVDETPDTMSFDGIKRFKGATVDSHNDHRIAMSLAMASLCCDGDITIINAGSVKKSFPNFWEVFESLGGEVIYE